jgi:hypothetical protein
MGDHGVRAGAPEVGGPEPLENLVGQAVGRGEGQVQGLGVGDPRTLEVRRLRRLLLRQGLDLGGRAVDEDGPDVQGPQHRDVGQDVGEVVVGHDRPVHRHHERLLSKLRYVLQHAAEVGGFHALPGK